MILVSYVLKGQDHDYRPLTQHLQKFTHCHGMEPVWLLDTNKTATQIRDELSRFIRTDDVLFIARLTEDWAARHSGCGDWLNHMSRTWQFPSHSADQLP
ncbi:hypothetical protein [Noviherbaspirillum massiliense]|uniref:hypothetical protein n=1 Tax=Noviherbaspirillum massiliense TaxID=1465823 RepID=UPI0011DCA5CA|nr:hypothetical protein [Noviherbaspirillum massiliense]